MECGIHRFDTRHVVILESRIPEQSDDINSSLMKFCNGYGFEMCFQTFKCVRTLLKYTVILDSRIIESERHISFKHLKHLSSNRG
jgi:hypothetical protein